MTPAYNAATPGGNDIDGGNTPLHDATPDPVTAGGASAASAPAADDAPEGGAVPEGETAPAGEAAPESNSTPEQGATSEEPGSTDVVTLEPMLITEAPAGIPMVITAIVETHGGVYTGVPVTLHWTTATGVQGQASALVNDSGIAAFVVTVPAGGTRFTAVAGEVESNGMFVSGF